MAWTEMPKIGNKSYPIPLLAFSLLFNLILILPFTVMESHKYATNAFGHPFKSLDQPVTHDNFSIFSQPFTSRLNKYCRLCFKSYVHPRVAKSVNKGPRRRKGVVSPSVIMPVYLGCLGHTPYVSWPSKTTRGSASPTCLDQNRNLNIRLKQKNQTRTTDDLGETGCLGTDIEVQFRGSIFESNSRTITMMMMIYGLWLWRGCHKYNLKSRGHRWDMNVN